MKGWRLLARAPPPRAAPWSFAAAAVSSIVTFARKHRPATRDGGGAACTLPRMEALPRDRSSYGPWRAEATVARSSWRLGAELVASMATAGQRRPPWPRLSHLLARVLPRHRKRARGGEKSRYRGVFGEGGAVDRSPR
jgi:hypothetical protein